MKRTVISPFQIYDLSVWNQATKLANVEKDILDFAKANRVTENAAMMIMDTVRNAPRTAKELSEGTLTGNYVKEARVVAATLTADKLISKVKDKIPDDDKRLKELVRIRYCFDIAKDRDFMRDNFMDNSRTDDPSMIPDECEKVINARFEEYYEKLSRPNEKDVADDIMRQLRNLTLSSGQTRKVAKNFSNGNIIDAVKLVSESYRVTCESAILAYSNRGNDSLVTPESCATAACCDPIVETAITAMDSAEDWGDFVASVFPVVLTFGSGLLAAYCSSVGLFPACYPAIVIFFIGLFWTMKLVCDEDAYSYIVGTETCEKAITSVTSIVTAFFANVKDAWCKVMNWEKFSDYVPYVSYDYSHSNDPNYIDGMVEYWD